MLKTIPCTKKLILIALKASLCPCFHYNNFSGLKINILKMRKHYNKSIFYHYDDKKSTISYDWGGQEEDDWLNNRK